MPDGVTLLPDLVDDRVQAARRLRALCPVGTIAILHANETLSPALAAELRCQGAESTAPCTYRAPVELCFLGQRFEAPPVTVAWAGDPEAPGPVVECRSSLVVRLGSLQRLVATLDRSATRAAAQDRPVTTVDLLWGPAWRFVRCAWRRRHAGTAGLILSVVETYQQVLTAGKVWERTSATRPLGAVPPAFRRRNVPQG